MPPAGPHFCFRENLFTFALHKIQRLALNTGLMQNLQAFQAFLETPRNIIITTHHKPDADALGSSLGLRGILRQLGHTVTVVTPTDYPEFLFWMEGNNEVINYEASQRPAVHKMVQEAHLIFCLDFGALHRINELGQHVAQSPAPKVLIDHHLHPDAFALYTLHDTGAAATAQLIYRLVELMGWQQYVSVPVAEALYAGLMTDTGSFKHPNTTREVHEIAAKLIDHGANNAKVAKLIYDTNSLNRLRFLGYALSNKLTVVPGYPVAYIAITAQELQEFDSKTGDTEGLVNYALSIKGIAMAAVIIDRTVAVKLSLRSIGSFAVNELAHAHFEGGGHRNAAGGKSEQSLEQTVAKFTGLLPQYKQALFETIENLKEHA